MHRDATIQFFPNRSENSEDQLIPIQSETSTGFFFINVEFLHFSVFLIVTLLYVKHNLLQYFSTGGSKVLGMQPKSGSRDRSEWAARAGPG